MPMSRPSQTESAYVQTVPDGVCLCPDYRTFKSLMRYSCVWSRICPDYPRQKAYMSRFLCVLSQTIVRSKSNSCVPAPKFWCVYDQTIVRSLDRKKITSCGAVLFLEDEGGRGFLKFNFFHRVNLLLKLNQFSRKIFGIVCLEKIPKNGNSRLIQIKYFRCLYRTKGLSKLNQLRYGVFLM